MGTTAGAVRPRYRGHARTSLGRHAHIFAEPAQPVAGETLMTLRRYADLFNDHNWDGLRELLGAESRLEVVSRVQHPVRWTQDTTIAMLRTPNRRPPRGSGLRRRGSGDCDLQSAVEPRSRYFVLLEVSAGRISLIRDFRYIPYITIDARYATFGT